MFRSIGLGPKIKDEYIDFGVDDEWIQLKQLFEILKPCNTATILFQTENAILTELYKVWGQCYIALEREAYL